MNIAGSNDAAVISAVTATNLVQSSSNSSEALSIVAGSDTLLGSAGMTQLVNSSYDDAYVQVNLPNFNFNFYGNSYSALYPGSNTYITAGSGSSNWSGLRLADNPPLPGIHLGTADNSYQRLWSLNTNPDFVRIYYEGTASTGGTVGNPNIVYEATFFKPTAGYQYIEVVFGAHSRSNGNFGVSSGSSNPSPTAGVLPIDDYSSYVFRSDATGNNWTITPNSHVENGGPPILNTTVQFAFTDVDLADIGHTVSVTDVVATGVTSGLTLSSDALKSLITPGLVRKLSDSSAGSFDLNFSINNTAINYLALNEVLTLTYTVQIDDVDGGIALRNFDITITGRNDAPAIASGSTGSIAENTPGNPAIYTVVATDIDASDVLTYSLANTGDYSYLNINPATGAVTLKMYADYETKASYSFTVVATDAGGLSSSKAVTVSVINMNESPIFSPSVQSLTYTDTVATDSFSPTSGTFIATDVDANTTLTYGIQGVSASGGVATLAGSYGTLAVTTATGAYTFTPNSGSINDLSANTSEIYTVTVSDGAAITNLTYTINIAGVSEVPVTNGVNFAWYSYAGNLIASQGDPLTVSGTSGNTSTRDNFYLGDSELAAAVGRADMVFIRAYASIQIPDVVDSSTFTLNLASLTDDGVEVWIDSGMGYQSVISNRTDHGPTPNYGSITVPDNSLIPIKVEWWENGGGALLDIYWSTTSGGSVTTDVAHRLTGSSLLAIGSATPLILDLNDDGVHTLIADQVVQYDLLATGTPASVGWSSPEDGFLVFDINSDGVINNGSEMFGDATRLSNGNLASHGFEALADLDFNLDGMLDSNDPLFSSLQVWKDANSDGITDIGELFSLGDQNILSFDLGPQASERVENGNQIKLVSTYSTTDGAHHEIADVWLKMTFNQDTQSPIIG